jgi:endopolyphosphatase
LTAVRGCEWGDIQDAGNLEFDWLDVQLGLFRDRGMYVSNFCRTGLSNRCLYCLQVYLTGHVPPSPGNYFPECVRNRCSIPCSDLNFPQYVRYTELALRFQDIILGHLYGVRPVVVDSSIGTDFVPLSLLLCALLSTG